MFDSEMHPLESGIGPVNATATGEWTTTVTPPNELAYPQPETTDEVLVDRLVLAAPSGHETARVGA
jgi:hypothetical protein